MDKLKNLTWADLTEPQPDETKTMVELAPAEKLSAIYKSWRQGGVVILKDFMPKELRDRYSEARAKLPDDPTQKDNFKQGWHFPTPYMICPELKDIALWRPLMDVMKMLIGEEMGLHLCLTGWVSTQRSWHQDTYLNPPGLWSRYCAVWIALEDISPDSGPFEFVPGSNNWEVLRREKLFAHLTNEEKTSADWPTFTQEDVARVCMEEVARRKAEVHSFTAKAGDVLIWHSNLIHRGSPPKNPDLLRKSLICHYSSLAHRTDMQAMRRHKSHGIYFDLPTTGSVRPTM